jgi:hypothetical protein
MTSNSDVTRLGKGCRPYVQSRRIGSPHQHCARNKNEIFKKHKLTIGLDLGDRTNQYCVLDEAGNAILGRNLPTTPKSMHQVFSKIPHSRLAPETGTHSPWASRQLSQLGHEGLPNVRHRVCECWGTLELRLRFSKDRRPFACSKTVRSASRNLLNQLSLCRHSSVTWLP